MGIYIACGAKHNGAVELSSLNYEKVLYRFLPNSVKALTFSQMKILRLLKLTGSAGIDYADSYIKKDLKGANSMRIAVAGTGLCKEKMK